MANKLLLRFALLLSLVAIVLSASDSSESKEKSSSSKSAESSDEKSKEESGSSEEKKKSDKRKTTTKPPKKSDTKDIDKLILDTFKLTSDPKDDDFNEFLKAMEYKKSDRDKIRNAKDVSVRVRKLKRNKYEVTVYAGFFQVKSTKFTLGKEFSDKLFDGRTYKGTVTFEGKNKVVVDEKHAGFTCHHEFEFSKKGFTSKLDCKGVTAEQEYKRKKEDENPFKGFYFRFGR